jgi:hypothetical protein
MEHILRSKLILMILLDHGIALLMHKTELPYKPFLMLPFLSSMIKANQSEYSQQHAFGQDSLVLTIISRLGSMLIGLLLSLEYGMLTTSTMELILLIRQLIVKTTATGSISEDSQ